MNMKTRVRRNALLFSIIFEISIFAIIFDLSLTSPVHELGHFLACLTLGVSVYSIEWNRLVHASVSDWRQNVIGYSGGLFAVLFLLCLYILSTVSLSHIHPQTKRGMIITNYFTLFVKATILTDMIMQFIGAAMEGTNPATYESFIQNVFALYVVTLIFSAVSFFMIIKRSKTMVLFES